MSQQSLAKILKPKYKGVTNVKLGQQEVKYATLECVPNVTQGSLMNALENFEFEEGHRYWISAFYRFGRRGGQSFDGNNFNETSLYNIAREYKKANNDNNEVISYDNV